MNELNELEIMMMQVTDKLAVLKAQRAKDLNDAVVNYVKINNYLVEQLYEQFKFLNGYKLEYCDWRHKYIGFNTGVFHVEILDHIGANSYTLDHCSTYTDKDGNKVISKSLCFYGGEKQDIHCVAHPFITYIKKTYDEGALEPVMVPVKPTDTNNIRFWFDKNEHYSEDNSRKDQSEFKYEYLSQNQKDDAIYNMIWDCKSFMEKCIIEKGIKVWSKL